MSMPAWVMVESPSMAAMPKSVRITRSEVSSTLPGLTSRCMIPAAWAWRSASSTRTPISAVWTTGSGPLCRTACSRDQARTSSITIQGRPSSSTTSWTVTMPGWLSRAAERASRSIRWCATCLPA